MLNLATLKVWAGPALGSAMTAATRSLNMKNPSVEELQRPQERDDRLLLAGRQAPEPHRHFARLTPVPNDGVPQRQRRLVVHQPRVQPHAPQRRRANLVLRTGDAVERQVLPFDLIDTPAVVLGHRHDDAVAGADVMQQEIAERMKRLVAEGGWNRERAAVDRTAGGDGG